MYSVCIQTPCKELIGRFKKAKDSGQVSDLFCPVSPIANPDFKTLLLSPKVHKELTAYVQEMYIAQSLLDTIKTGKSGHSVTHNVNEIMDKLASKSTGFTAKSRSSMRLVDLPLSDQRSVMRGTKNLLDTGFLDVNDYLFCTYGFKDGQIYNIAIDEELGQVAFTTHNWDKVYTVFFSDLIDNLTEPTNQLKLLTVSHDSYTASMYRLTESGSFEISALTLQLADAVQLWSKVISGQNPFATVERHIATNPDVIKPHLCHVYNTRS